MKSFISKFVVSRSKSQNDTYELHTISKGNFLSCASPEFEEDKDYYADFMGCLFCKENFHSYAALFIHMKLCHKSHDFYHYVCNDSIELNYFRKIAILTLGSKKDILLHSLKRNRNLKTLG
jgi:hypothetical protein